MMSGFFESVYAVVKRIPEGKVLTYGDVARAVGAPRCARQVGWALHSNPQPGVIPCHRVVGGDGSLTGYAGGIDKKIALLRFEKGYRDIFFVPKKSTAP